MSSPLISLAQRLGLRVDLPAAAWRSLQPCLLQQHQAQRRSYSTIEEHKEEIESINDLFVEARDEIDYAKEDAESVYFNESHEAASKAVQGVIGRYQAVLDGLSEEERGKLQRSMGLKMEQLKAELALLDTLHD